MDFCNLRAGLSLTLPRVAGSTVSNKLTKKKKKDISQQRQTPKLQHVLLQTQLLSFPEDEPLLRPCSCFGSRVEI